MIKATPERHLSKKKCKNGRRGGQMRKADEIRKVIASGSRSGSILSAYFAIDKHKRRFFLRGNNFFFLTHLPLALNTRIIILLYSR